LQSSDNVSARKRVVHSSVESETRIGLRWTWTADKEKVQDEDPVRDVHSAVVIGVCNILASNAFWIPQEQEPQDPYGVRHNEPTRTIHVPSNERLCAELRASQQDCQSAAWNYPVHDCLLSSVGP
jgi:hypothetical protein